MYADVDNGADTMKKKILLGEQAQYNFIFGMSFSLLCRLPHLKFLSCLPLSRRPRRDGKSSCQCAQSGRGYQGAR